MKTLQDKEPIGYGLGSLARNRFIIIIICPFSENETFKK